jgi:hypothetical protein
MEYPRCRLVSWRRRLAAVPTKLLCVPAHEFHQPHASVAGAIEYFESPNVRQGDDGARLELNSQDFAPATGSAGHVGRLFLEQQTELAEVAD